ncbi:type VII secretion system-associated protein [Streptomyces sp. NPDC056716]|uniref:type VII secretion system-associated protein n=1 Tax=unclassified Streptomyces TaxID=2593676 RepID=UPI0036C0A5CD
MTTPDPPPSPPTPPSPPVPEDIRAAARLAPDHWLGVVDPAWDAQTAPPRWAVVGEWRSGASGEVEEWRANPEYRPSPLALGWPVPTDAVDAAVQALVTGYDTVDAVLRALSEAELLVLRAPQGEPLTALGQDGGLLAPAYTAPQHLHAAGFLAHDLVTARELARVLAPSDTYLLLNPAGPASLSLKPGELLASEEQPAEDPPVPPV